MTFAYKRLFAAAGLTLAATPALAHTGGAVSGFASGLAHPVLGVDHLMAMVAVGIWSAAGPARTAWRGPALFIAVLGLGAVLGMSGLALPFVEPGILASIFVLGAMIVAARFLPAAAGMAAIAGFALLHGHAHGVEAAGAVSGYMAGLVLTSALLHAGGYVVGRLVSGMRYGMIVSGMAVAAGGLVLAAG
ncbi:HupE/UreJ family protein [Oricola thermophila]|uniref:HupE/UreJ family protein n=1 Tax=Oricola thermophila TaxID=2742145 RepID=A0A6N1V8Q7_9HYPH|nr:HupE/UreJ family protein [Oricola thermophila]QKV17310.1 HupE/UreJ family protein [Oricola thermophila]